MSAALQLQITYSGGTFTFSVEGEYLPRWEPSYKVAANPPVVTEMRLVWEFRQCRLISTTVDGLWTSVSTLNTMLSARSTGHPTAAALVRDPAGVAVTLITLGPSDYEGFQIEADGETDAILPRASWRTAAAFTLRISAIKRNEDGNGIVDWDQRVNYRYEAGLAIVELVTRLSTVEGTSAVTKAQTYATLDVNNFGSDYTYETNGPDGIDYTYTDADEVNSRTPTVVECVSRLRRWGVTVGTTGPGGSPDSVGYEVLTRRTAKETVTRYTISATGPNYLSWVASRKPAGSLAVDELTDRKESRSATGVYEIRVNAAAANGGTREVKVEITGGARAFDYEPVAGDYEPVEFTGSYLPWQATVSVTVTRVGGSGANSEMMLPGLLGEPWRLDRNASTESEPYEIEEDDATDSAQQKWGREARLVYRSARAPEGALSPAINAAPMVASYYLGQPGPGS